MILFGLTILIFNLHAIIADTFNNQFFCPDYHPQRTLDLDQLMGAWYIIEIIHHKRDEGMVHGSISLKVCPQIFIGRESRSDMRLIWKEPSATFYYKIRLDNHNNPGSWISSGPHNESSTSSSFFTHFTGTIQVMKAVGNHMALTFCTTQNDRSLFSVVLSRERKLSKLEIRGVNNMLQRRGLEPLLSKYTCSNCDVIKPFLTFLLLISTFQFFL
ncbi:conserved hypothetical protein [Pediculus humanus corporis]|uniref:Uncharacterized protein n=1 Tax=Pediculus humanus subsp. corporis TaxID=121224 RepID=E0VI39_PEDHC|nr:uncharacterized protein Phum_PHUM220560 [Pediculus humanus corporis]EEB13045.1 conserved hypothetical protein [Pediculus humanus corporis]